MFSLNCRKNIYYYLIFSLIYLLVHIGLYSTVSFFHFLLDHDMATIDSWISKNNWEMIFFSKLSAFFICLKFISLNYSDRIHFWTEFKLRFHIPSLRGVLFCSFLVGIIVYLAKIYYIPAKINLELEDSAISAYLGSIGFFGLDTVLLLLISTVYPIDRKEKNKLYLISLIIFSLTTKLSIAYLGAYLILAILHFSTLFLLSMNGRLSDATLYGFIVIGPLNSSLGLNLFSGWEETRSYGLQFFIVLVFVWLTGLLYYRFSRLN